MSDLNSRRRAIQELIFQSQMALRYSELKDMTCFEQQKFKQDHAGAHFIIGNFEIKCLNPEKYGIE